MKMLFQKTLLLMALAGVVSCRSSQSGLKSQDSDDPWAKHEWIDKAANALLYGGYGLSPAESDQLMALPRSAIVDRLMQDPRFYQTVVDFNSYFLGNKVNKLNDGSASGISDNALAVRTTLVAARELAKNGDYFLLFADRIPYIPILRLDTPEVVQNRADLDTPAKRRDYWLAAARQAFGTLNSAVNAAPSNNALCQILTKQFSGDDGNYTEKISNAGLPSDVASAASFDTKIYLGCGVIDGQVTQAPGFRAEVLAQAEFIQGVLAKLPSIAAQFPADNGNSQNVSVQDAKTLTPQDLGVPPESPIFDAFSSLFWSKLTNSSTNYNRKRAAYVLKTYFCDDLTPLNIAVPSAHTSNRHASDPSCQSCHYKLDPMAGFFKNRGLFGLNFKDTGILIHDDQVRREGASLAEYLNSWKAPEGSGRTWNIGYIRSPRKESLNAYGENLHDLFQIIRTAPETKACLTKRMAEYFLGGDQSYDGQWLASLSQRFVDAAKPDAPKGASSQAFKDVVKSLVLSQTFSTPDPVKGQCYDFAPGAHPPTLPCQVSYIIEKNCTSCHKGDGAPNGLDLSVWRKQADGQFNFKDIDEDSGVQVPRAKTLTRIACSLSASPQCQIDPETSHIPQMPMNRDIDAVEKATLYKWVQSEASGVKP